MKQLFKSDVTGKVYDSEEECLKAEREHGELVAKQNEEREERKKSADEIKGAYESYLALCAKNRQSEQESYNRYLDLRNKFVDKYGSYHLTISQKDDLKPKVDFGIDELNRLADCVFRNFWLF